MAELVWRFLSVLGLLLALCGAGVRPAEAYPAQRTAALSGSPCTNKIASLDFAANSGNGVYCLNRTRYSSPTFIPGLASARASAGDAQTSAGTLVSFGSGVPRITDLGLLDELSATNLILQSQTFDSATWVKTNATVTADATTAPDGTTTADKLVASVGSAQHYVGQGVSGLTASEARTISVYAKYAGVKYLAMYMSQGPAVQAWYDLQGGTVSNVTGSATITALANGWYRCTLTAPAAAGTSDTFEIHAAATAGSFTFNGDGVNGVYTWGAQLERPAAFATSYIPTTTAAVTRAADALTLTYSPAGSAATVTYGTNSTASVSPTSPINLGSSSSGAWVGNYIRKLVVTP